MEFRIADTFTDSLPRLTGAEQKAVKTTAFDAQRFPGKRLLKDSLPEIAGQEHIVQSLWCAATPTRECC
jgi:hypothetical protein